MEREKLKTYIKTLLGKTLTDVNPACEMLCFTFDNICMENDIIIQIFISNGAQYYGEDNEQWRIFEKGNPKIPHLVVYSKTIQNE